MIVNIDRVPKPLVEDLMPQGCSGNKGKPHDLLSSSLEDNQFRLYAAYSKAIDEYSKYNQSHNGVGAIPLQGKGKD